MEEVQLIMIWSQQNITIQRHNMEQEQLIMIWWQHNLTIRRHNECIPITHFIDIVLTALMTLHTYSFKFI